MDYTIKSCKCNIDVSKLKILTRSNDEYAFRLLESIFIYKDKPDINNNDTVIYLFIYKCGIEHTTFKLQSKQLNHSAMKHHLKLLSVS